MTWPMPEILGVAETIGKRIQIAKTGTAVTKLYLIESGVIGRFLGTSDKRVLEGVRGPDWLIGAVAAVAKRPHIETVISLGECAVRPMTVEAFQQARRHHGVEQWLTAMMATEVASQLAHNAALIDHCARTLIEE